MQSLKLVLCLVVAAAGALVVGCGGGNSHGLTLAPVTGLVTYRGQPLADAQVVFLPDTPGQLPAMGMTDAQGKYELLTIVPGDGASLGKHRVTVTARQQSAAPAEPVAPGTGPTGAPRIPEKYFSFDTSGLTAEVKSEGTTADFALSDQ
jgi:hypothetical protein